MNIVIVAAVAENGVIGSGNEMPWKLRSDLQRFRALTWGKPVIMGRKTYLSIGKPLPGRTNIVVSRNQDFAARGIVVARTIEGAIEVARADALRRGSPDIMVIGGAEIYAALLPRADRLEITHVHSRPQGDAHFPDFDRGQWEEIRHETICAGPQDTASLSFSTYVRASAT